MIRQTRTRAALCALALLLSGCATQLVKTGPQSVDGIALDSPLTWTSFGSKGERVWTRDGSPLNTLRIIADLEPGRPLFGTERRVGVEGVRFAKGLSRVATLELLVEGLRAAGWDNVETVSTEPATLGGKPALRAELTLARPSGLRYRALLLAESADDTLSLLLFTAPEEHYFNRDRAAVEQIFASAR